jgi:threonine/homoserine/homoserine lactone efflux protein
MTETVSRSVEAVLGAAAIRYAAIVPLVLTALAIMGSPGPATVSLTATGSAFGVRRSLAYLSGIVVGTVLVLVAVATGLTAALLAVPALRPALIVVAAAYILWLAYHIATAPPLETQADASKAPTLRGGTLLGVANPKAWVAIAAVFAGTRIAEGATLDAAIKVAVLAAMIVVINSAWLLAGASLAPVLRDPRRGRVVNVALAVALVATTALAVVH